MICLTCHAPTAGRLCRACVLTLRPAPERLLPGGIRVVAPFAHEGAARRLVHLLKYKGIMEYAHIVSELLAPRLPPLPLVPVPRALSRRARYGVDPALAIADSLSELTGAPVLRILGAHWHARRRAGGDHGRDMAPFRVRPFPHAQVIVVDDVVTTGATMLSAAAALGPERVRMAAAANSVLEGSSLFPS